MRRNKRFEALLEIYNELPGKNRQIRYWNAESIYRGIYGESAYNSYRIFSAKLSLHYTQDVPHSAKHRI